MSQLVIMIDKLISNILIGFLNNLSRKIKNPFLFYERVVQYKYTIASNFFIHQLMTAIQSQQNLVVLEL